jgi:D-alanyl-D-alanine carboxypeptidase/D-alanyl-D-alanine-endopeptidase (penicillin-binding protein 4)
VSLLPARLGAALVALAVVLSFAVAGPAHALSAAGLRTKLSNESKLLGGSSGARVVDLDTGEVLFAKRDDLPLAPASNEKLFTTSVALLRFGAGGTLNTSAQALPGAAIDAGGVLRGDLYLVGGGDPSLDDGDLRTLATQLTADAGITRITGSVRGDESFFDRLRGSYDSGYGPDSDLGGRLGALTWGHGRFDAKGPAHVAATRLHFFLRKAGVKVGRKPTVGTFATDDAGGAASDRPVELASVSSPPMSALAAITNQPSDNFYAETLVKALGARFGSGGTTTAGIAVLRDTLGTFGIRPRLLDGSGLSRADRTTARQVIRLLERMHDQPDVRDAWSSSLAVVGRSGTLRKRMRGTAAQGACRAKTGTLIGVSALSGYCKAANGHTIAFSLLENRVYALGAKRVEDRMVPAIARYSDAPVR